MKHYVVFAGTTEGRMICEAMLQRKQPVTVCVASDYGEIVLPNSPYLTVCVGRRTKDDMVAFFKEQKPDLVIDATHPYAVLVTQHIKAACETLQISYERVIRESEETSNAIWVSDIQKAAELLDQTEETALITTGSKELLPYQMVHDYKERLYFRVLPTVEAIHALTEIGVKANHIIAMQGPFSEELNFLMIKERKAKFLVTKESGTIGGFCEKERAATRANATLIVIKRPEEEIMGKTVCKLLEELKGIDTRNVRNDEGVSDISCS